MTDPNERLDNLFQAYRAACPAPEISAGFMPGLWKKIDGRRSFTWKLRIYSRSLATAAAALCMVMAVYQMSPVTPQVNPAYTQTYLEALQDDNPVETLAFADVRPDLP